MREKTAEDTNCFIFKNMRSKDLFTDKGDGGNLEMAPVQIMI